MGKIKDFFSKWFDSEFCLGIPLFLIIFALSIGVQSLLVWIGGLFPSVEHLGITIDAILGMVLLLLMHIKIDLIRFTIDERFKENLMCGFMIEQMVIYIYVVCWGQWPLLIIGLLLLSSSRHLQEYEYYDACSDVYEAESICLLYCIGAYFAMLFNDIEPAANIYGIIILSIVTLIIWFVPKLLKHHFYGSSCIS